MPKKFEMTKFEIFFEHIVQIFVILPQKIGFKKF